MFICLKNIHPLLDEGLSHTLQLVCVLSNSEPSALSYFRISSFLRPSFHSFTFSQVSFYFQLVQLMYEYKFGTG